MSISQGQPALRCVDTYGVDERLLKYCFLGSSSRFSTCTESDRTTGTQRQDLSTYASLHALWCSSVRLIVWVESSQQIPSNTIFESRDQSQECHAPAQRLAAPNPNPRGRTTANDLQSPRKSLVPQKIDCSMKPGSAVVVASCSTLLPSGRDDSESTITPWHIAATFFLEGFRVCGK